MSDAISSSAPTLKEEEKAVTAEVTNLDNHANRLRDTVGRLEDALVRVLSSTKPEPGQDGPEAKEVCALQGELQSIDRHLCSSHVRLVDILERLEL